MEGLQPVKEQPMGVRVLTFYTPPTQTVKGDLSYQRPVVPTQNHQLPLLSPWQQEYLLRLTHLYIRTFSTGLCACTFILLLCISSMPWVQFLSAKNGLELHVGLWTLCKHALCWSHVPNTHYYLKISRLFFLLSVLTAFLIIFLVINSCRQGKEPTSSLDLKVTILSLTSGASLFFCLVLFMMQVKKYTSYTMGSSYLWIFYFNWWGSFFYIVAGIISLFNYKTFGLLPSDVNTFEILLTKRRLGINPKMWSTPATEEDLESEMVVDPVVDIESIVASMEKKEGDKVKNNE